MSMSYRHVICDREHCSGSASRYPHVFVASKVVEELDLSQTSFGQDFLREDVGNLRRSEQ